MPKKYETISVPADVKRILEKAKGRNEWGKFSLNLYTEATGPEHEEAFKKLVGILTDDDLKAMAESSRRFREGLALDSIRYECDHRANQGEKI